MTPDCVDLFEGIRGQRGRARSGGSSAWSQVKQRSMELPSAGCSAAAGEEVVVLRMNRRGGLYLLLLCWILSAQPAAHGKSVLISNWVPVCACMNARVCGWCRPDSHIVARPCPCYVNPLPVCVCARVFSEERHRSAASSRYHSFSCLHLECAFFMLLGLTAGDSGLN